MKPLKNGGLSPEVSVLFPEIAPNKQAVFQVGKETVNDLNTTNNQQTIIWQEFSESSAQ